MRGIRSEIDVTAECTKDHMQIDLKEISWSEDLYQIWEEKVMNFPISSCWKTKNFTTSIETLARNKATKCKCEAKSKANRNSQMVTSQCLTANRKTMQSILHPFAAENSSLKKMELKLPVCDKRRLSDLGNTLKHRIFFYLLEAYMKSRGEGWKPHDSM